MNRILTVLLLIYSGTASAQFPSYYVYLIKNGKGVFLKKTNQKKSTLTAKTYLFDDDEIIISDNSSEVMLLSKDQKRLIHTKKGTTKVADLKKASQESISVTRKYFDLVFQSILQTPAIGNRITKENVAASWGAANRGFEDCTQLHFPVDEQQFSKNKQQTITFDWETEQPGSVSFVLYDKDHHAIYQILVPENHLTISPVLWIKNPSDTHYYWAVTPETSDCGLKTEREFDVLSKETYQKKLAAIIAGVPKNNDKFIYSLQLIDALGKKGFIDESYSTLQTIIAK